MNWMRAERGIALPSTRSSYVNWYAGDRDQHLTTPRPFFETLHAEFRFTLDGAASTEHHLLPRFSTKEHPISWLGERVFCNPPWSSIPPFVEAALYADLAVLLVPARTNIKWFHRALGLGAGVRYFLGRPTFGSLKHNSPVDCLLLVFGDPA